MKIQYKFANETIEVEVDDAWSTVMLELDRQEYNADHRQLRHNCSLDALNLDGNLIDSGTDIFEEYVKSENTRRIYAALGKLLPRHRYLLEQVYFMDRKIVDIAREEGLHESSVREALSRAKKNFKKYF